MPDYNPYSSASILGYNATPPSDDGSETANNTVEWAKHKTKLADPIKTLAEAIDTNVLAAFGKLHLNSANAKSGAYTVTTSDIGKIIPCTGTFTVTLPAAATALQGFHVVIQNVSTGTITVDGDGSETINGSATVTIDEQYDALAVMCDGSNWLGLQYEQDTELVLDTSVALSGTSVTWSSLPAGLNLIILSINGASHDSGSNQRIQLKLGDSGGIESSGYSEGAETGTSWTSASGAAFALTTSLGAGSAFYGQITLARQTGNTWSLQGSLTDASSLNIESAGIKALSGELDRVELGVSGGNFDAGSANIMYM